MCTVVFLCELKPPRYGGNCRSLASLGMTNLFRHSGNYSTLHTASEWFW
jgi:hypothetical protein